VDTIRLAIELADRLGGQVTFCQKWKTLRSAAELAKHVAEYKALSVTRCSASSRILALLAS
jgi:hypothetical protein